jgi:hypothetical protein
VQRAGSASPRKAKTRNVASRPRHTPPSHLGKTLQAQAASGVIGVSYPVLPFIYRGEREGGVGSRWAPGREQRSFKNSLIAIAFAGMYLESLFYIQV